MLAIFLNPNLKVLSYNLVVIKSYTSTGIVLSSIKYSEADRILKIYSKNYGKLSLIAKGVRKPISKKRGSLEVFNAVNFHATWSATIGLITEVEMINSFEGIRKDLNKMSLAYFYCEVIEKLTREGSNNYKLYNLLFNAFIQLEESKGYKIKKDKFIYDVLVELGFWPLGQKIIDPDSALENVIERKLSSVRVGKKVLQ